MVQGVTSNYETDLFREIMSRIEELSGKRYGQDEKQDVSFRVISDHSRAVAFLIGDGVMPSNEGRGYVLRRIIRRAIRFGQGLGLKDAFLHRVAGQGDRRDGAGLRRTPHLQAVHRRDRAERGEAVCRHPALRDEDAGGEPGGTEAERGEKPFPGQLAFKLYDTYGLSLDIVEDVAREEGFRIDQAGYEQAMARQRNLSQEAWKGSGEEEIPETYRKLAARGVRCDFRGYEGLMPPGRRCWPS